LDLAAMSVLIFFVVLGCLGAATILGLYLSATASKAHLDARSKEVIHGFMGVIAHLIAVVLGLLIFSAKTSFDTKDSEFKHASAKVVLLDRVLAHYGPKAQQARDALRSTVEKKLVVLDTGGKFGAEKRQRTFVSVEDVQDRIRALAPESEAERWLKERALALSGDIAQARWFLLDELDSTIPRPFVVIMVFWLMLIFFSYGLFTPRNATVLAVLAMCAVSLASSVYLVLEMDNSLEGPISISTEPLHQALDELSN
jgi:hypothetical protein